MNREQLHALFDLALRCYGRSDAQAWADFCTLYLTIYDQLPN